MRYAMTLVMAAGLMGVPFITGCDKTVSEDQKTTQSKDGTMKTQDTKVTQGADGTMSKTTETKTNNP